VCLSGRSKFSEKKQERKPFCVLISVKSVCRLSSLARQQFFVSRGDKHQQLPRSCALNLSRMAAHDTQEQL
jgi:hypothetical protein